MIRSLLPFFMTSLLFACSGGSSAPSGGEALPTPLAAPSAPPPAPSAPAPAAPASASQPVAEPASYDTTLGSSTIDGVTFEDVRATCGLFEVMALLGNLGRATSECGAGRVRVGLEAGSAHVQALSGEGECLARTISAQSFGGTSCTLELSISR